MINLLPTKEKKDLILGQNKKLIIVLGTMFLIAIVCLTLILSAIKFHILGEKVAQSFILDQAKKKYQTPEFLVYQGLLESYNKKFIQIKSFYKSNIQISAAIKDVLSVGKPKGVYFTNFSMVRSKDSNKIILKISGTADTRDNLLLFKKNLELSNKIKNPNFSPESWISSKDIDFYLTLEINGN